jgi:hydroxypyruvate isomerase
VAAAGTLAAGQAAAQEAGTRGPFAGAPLKISAPLHWFPGETPVEKLAAMDGWGLPAYEWLGADAETAEAMRARADRQGMTLSCMLGAGAIAPGQMVQPADHDGLVADFERACGVAKAYGCTRLIGLTGNAREDVSHDEQMAEVIACVRRLAPIAEANGITLVLEALNTRVDHPGFFLTTTDQTMAIVRAAGSPNVKMLFDIYHQQITEGDVIRRLTEHIDHIGHFHVADNPGRNQPGTGELNYANIFKAIAETGYDGFVALEMGYRDSYENGLRATLACLEQV